MAASQAVILATQTNNGHAGVANGSPLELAHTGLVDWFQYNGNTYIVEDINNANAAGGTLVNAATHSTLQSTDAVVELVGLVNLNTATFTGGTHLLHVV